MSEVRIIAEGIRGGEGPVALADGSVLVCEMAEGRLTRVLPSGKKSVMAITGGTPNGAAIGPDGKCYVCNRGPSRWREVHGLLLPIQEDEPGANGLWGSIQRVDLDAGKVETLYERVGEFRLRGPNDIVFDAYGGFWFTDFGRLRPRQIDRGSICYAKADGTFIREVITPMMGPNGIGLSHDGRWLYVAESFSAHLYRFEVTGPGEIRPAQTPLPGPGGYFVGGPGGFTFFDSLAIDSEGYVIVATPGIGVLTIFSPGKESKIEQISMPDPALTNICFGGKDLRTAYVTLMATGKLVAFEWPRPGLQLNYQ